MKRRIVSVLTALALVLSLCPTWAFATEADPTLCKHHQSHTEDCGYAAPTEGRPCGHEHTEDCYAEEAQCAHVHDESCYSDGQLPAEGGDKAADTCTHTCSAESGCVTRTLDCQHSHDSECGYVEADPGTPCGYECRICPIEDMIATLPEQVTEDNADDVRAQLDEILTLYRELNEDEQGQIDLSRVTKLQGALDRANASMMASEAETTYIGANGVQQTANCTPLTSSDSDVTLQGGWYVVNGEVTISGTLTFNGETHLILADGCMLTAKRIETTNLTIYGQAEGTGSLCARKDGSGDNGLVDESAPAIGSYGNDVSITINGGCVTAIGATERDTISGGTALLYVIGSNIGKKSSIAINGGAVCAIDNGENNRSLPPKADVSINNCIVISCNARSVVPGKVYGTAALPNGGQIGGPGGIYFRGLDIPSGAKLTSVGQYGSIPITMEDVPENFQVAADRIDAAASEDTIKSRLKIKSPFEGHTGPFSITGLTGPEIKKTEDQGDCVAYTATYTKGDQTASASFTLPKVNLSNSWAIKLPSGSYRYTGEEIRPQVTLEPRVADTLSGRDLTEGRDYEVTYENNIGPGQAFVTVTGIGGCYGSIRAGFQITEDAEEGRVTCAYADEYGGTHTVTAEPIKTNAGEATTLDTDWYAVTGEGATCKSIVVPKGKQASLILADGAKLNAKLDIKDSLTIYAQSEGTGELIAMPTEGLQMNPDAAPGILVDGGTLTVNGGKLTNGPGALGGMGTGLRFSGGKLIFNSGKLSIQSVDGSGEYLTEMLDAGRIVAPEGMTSSMTEAEIAGKVTVPSKTVSIGIAGEKSFTLTGWEGPTVTKNGNECTIAYTREGRDPVTKTVTLAVPCAHTNLVYKDNGDGTCGGTCPDCDQEVKEPHQWSEKGVCGNCHAQAAAKAEKGSVVLGYIDASSLGSAFGSGSDYEGATFTLLDDVELGTALNIYIGCTIDLNGHTIHCTDGSAIYIGGAGNAVTFQGEGEVIAESGAALLAGGTTTLKGGTYTSRGNHYAVDIRGKEDTLIVSGENVVIRCMGDNYGLGILSAKSVQLSAGTYSGAAGAIEIGSRTDLTFGGLLAENCAYYKDTAPIPLSELTGKTLQGTVTVGACGHQGSLEPNENGYQHGGSCKWCGTTLEQAGHTLDEATSTCSGCGAELAARVVLDNDEVNARYYDVASFAQAFALNEGQTSTAITLLDNVTVSQPLKVTTGSNITLLGNNNTITADISDPGVIGAIQVEGGSLDISNCIINSTKAGIYVSNGTVAINSCGVTAESNSGVCVTGNNATVTINGGSYSGADAGVYAAYGTVTIENGTFSGTGDSEAAGVFVGGSTVTIKGGAFTGDTYGLYRSAGAVHLTGGTFTGKTNAIKRSVNTQPLSDMINVDGKYYAFYKDSSPIPLEENATQLGPGTVTVGLCEHEGGLVPNANGYQHGGPCKWCGAVLEMGNHTTPTEGKCTECGAKLVAKVGGAYYTTIETAWTAAATAGTATVTLLDNVTVDFRVRSLEVQNGQDITFEGGNFTLTTEAQTPVIQVRTGGKLTVINGTVAANSEVPPIIVCGEFVMTGGAVKGLETGAGIGLVNDIGGTVKLSGGSFTGGKNAIAYGTGGEVKNALVNYGNTAGPHYAFYQDGKPYAPSGNSLPGGTFTVGTCKHAGVTPTSNQNGAHALNCPYCGFIDTAEGCTYVFNGATGTCAECGDSMTVAVSADNLIYDGTGKEPGVAVTRGETALTASDYSVTYTNNINAGTATVTVTIGNQQGTYHGNFTIGHATPLITWGTTAQELTYTGQQAAITAPTVALVNNENFMGTISYSYATQGGTEYKDGLPTNAGTYIIKAHVAAEGNYTAADSTTEMTIKPAPVTLTFNDQTITYGETPKAATADPPDSKIEYSYTIGAGGAPIPGWPTNAGTYTITAEVKASGNYGAASKTATLTIKQAAGSVSITGDPGKTYDGIAVSVPAYTKSGTGEVTVEYKAQGADDGTYAATVPSDAGIYTVRITVAADTNYTSASATKDFTVAQRAAEIAWSDVSFIYTGSEQKPSATVSNKVDGDTVTVTVTGGQTSAGGPYTATADALTGTDAGNYQMPSSKPTTSFTIGKADPVVTDVSVSTSATIYESTKLDAITLTHGAGPAGTVKLNAGQTLTVGTKEYNWTFTPNDTANYNTATGKISLSVERDTLQSIAITTAPTQTTYTYGESFDTAGMVITATYASGATKDVTGEVQISPETLTVATTVLTITYQGKTTPQAITVNPKTVTSPGIELSPSTFVYDGAGKEPAVTVKDGTTVIPASEYTVEYSNNINVGTTATVTITDKDGGNYTVNGSTTFTITAKPLTGAKVEVTGTFTYTGSALTPKSTVTLDGKTLAENVDYTVTYDKNTNAGTAEITVTGKGNYSGTVQGTFAIGRADLTVEGAGTASGTYGAKLSDLTVSGLTAKLNGNDVAGTWKLAGDTVPNVGDSGEYTATFAPTDGAGNYNALTAQVKLNIAKADYAGTKAASTSAKFGATGTYDLSALLPDGATAGTAATDSVIFEGVPAVRGKALTYTLKADATPNTTGTITVPVTSTNYKDFNLTITVTVTDREVPTLTVSPITVTYSGEAVPSTAIKGTAKVGDTTVPGTWSFTEGQALTNVADSGTKTVKFVPTDQGTYAEATGTVVVTIGKATPTGAPKYTAISTSGKTLADAGLTTEGGTFSTTGTVAWTLADTTEVTANTAYEWTFTPADAANYNTLTGKITLWVRSTGGGGGGGGSSSGGSSSGSSSLPVTTTGQGSTTTTTTTTAAPTASTQGGKATTTINTTMGQEIIKQAVANKSENVVIAPKVTGSVTKAEVSIPAATVGQIGSQTSATLTVSTPVADVTIPNGGLGSLASAGGTVTVTAQQTGTSVELTVTAGGKTVQNVPGGVTLTVPATSTTPGTVAVLVNPNGTREVVRKSVADDGAVTIPLDGSAKLEIVDNSGYFADVPATSWAADAVAFASSHELFNGTAPGQFSPNVPMSRGMLAVVLHNLESNPAQALTGAFTDVDNSQWYAEGVAWAAAQGIIGGYGNGRFGPDDNITREQLAVMLWRYAGSPAATDRELHFADADRASDWALEALRWAVEKGVLNGKGNGILDPGGEATRAETAQMLKNFMEKQ